MSNVSKQFKHWGAGAAHIGRAAITAGTNGVNNVRNGIAHRRQVKEHESQLGANTGINKRLRQTHRTVNVSRERGTGKHRSAQVF